MKGPALMAILGGGKAKSSDEAEPPESSSSPEDVYIDEFLAAVEEGDSAGAKAAFKSAVRACAKKEEADEYEEEA